MRPPKATQRNRRTRRILYAASAGDVFGTYLQWRVGRWDERQTAATYSAQFFDFCKSLQAEGIVSFPSTEKTEYYDGPFRIFSRRLPRQNVSTFRYYLNSALAALSIIKLAIRNKVDCVIAMDGSTIWLMLAPLRLIGIPIYVSVHTVMVPYGTRVKDDRRFSIKLERFFLKYFCSGALVASHEIERHIVDLSYPTSIPIEIFYPLYDRNDFVNFFAGEHPEGKFRLLYSGRIEAEKGIFDLLDAFLMLRELKFDIELDFCGDGSSLSLLKRKISSNHLDKYVRCHGHLSRSDLLKLYADSNAIIIPTRTEFPEGFNQVAVEAILAHRPVVTSAVCPALELIRPAALEAMPDNIPSYVGAIRALLVDKKLYDALVKASYDVADRFFNREEAWAAKMSIVISKQT